MRTLKIAGIFILLILLPAVRMFAQFPMAEGPTAEKSRSDSDADLEARVARMRYLLMLAEKRTATRGKDPKLALAELQDDFTNLQIVNKDLVLTTAKTTQVDLKFVEKCVVEIRKRAERLMENLALPEGDENAMRQQPKVPTTLVELKESITKLGWVIYLFAKNPLFKEAQLIETNAATKARRDLEEIILRTSQLKNATDALRAAQSKSR